MSNSPLVSYTKISPNRTSPRNREIDTITIHCVCGQATVEALGNVFAPTARQASSNYGVGKDGRIGMYCEEKDRSWCSSSGANDHRAITIEVASDTTPPYAVNEKAYNGLIDLLVDICQRNPGIGTLKWKNDKSLIGQVDKQNMTLHKWFYNTACPGEYLHERHAQIAAEVNARLNGTSAKAPVENVVEVKQESKQEGECKVNLNMLSEGAKGDDVKALQTLLNGYGYKMTSNGKTYGADGSFGPATKAAVMNYQKAKKLDVDGIVGPATWGSLLGVK